MIRNSSFLIRFGTALALSISVASLPGCGGDGGNNKDKAKKGPDNTPSVQPPAPTPEITLAPKPARDNVLAAPNLAAPNIVSVAVKKGVYNAINTPTVSVTVCKPKTDKCVTVPNILVDTGSVGLRVAKSALNNLELDKVVPLYDKPSDESNLTKINFKPGEGETAECAFTSRGYIFGSVKRADVKIGGETAINIPVQVLFDYSLNGGGIHEDCKYMYGVKNYREPLGDNLIKNTTELKANGVLGIEGYDTDFNGRTANTSAAGLNSKFISRYYKCKDNRCDYHLPVIENRVTNPVPRFQAKDGRLDNNGFTMNFPSVPPEGSPNIKGELIFGVNTRDNNQSIKEFTKIIVNKRIGAPGGIDKYYGKIDVNPGGGFNAKMLKWNDTDTQLNYIFESAIINSGLPGSIIPIGDPTPCKGEDVFLLKTQCSVKKGSFYKVRLKSVGTSYNYDAVLPSIDSIYVNPNAALNNIIYISPLAEGIINKIKLHFYERIVQIGFPFFYGKSITYVYDGASLPGYGKKGSFIKIDDYKPSPTN